MGSPQHLGVWLMISDSVGVWCVSFFRLVSLGYVALVAGGPECMHVRKSACQTEQQQPWAAWKMSQQALCASDRLPQGNVLLSLMCMFVL